MDSIDKVIEACETLYNFCMALDCTCCPLNGLIEDDDQIFCYLYTMKCYAKEIRTYKEQLSKMIGEGSLT